MRLLNFASAFINVRQVSFTFSMQPYHSDDEEPLDDKTAAIPLHSKRTERMQRKKASRDKKRSAVINLTKLPTEVILDVLEYLLPSDILSFSLANRRFRSVVLANSNLLGSKVVQRRYQLLSKCFPLPLFLTQVDPTIQPLLLDAARLQRFVIHHKPYQHVQAFDPQLLCTCISCVLAWNNLNVILDFAWWQRNLDIGEPIPMLPRGRTAEWNEKLVKRHASIVQKALRDRLWYAWMMETHLSSTVRAIRRHSKNKGNKRKHVEMTEEDAHSGTDDFLAKNGPPSLEFPYRRDEYYLLCVSILE